MKKTSLLVLLSFICVSAFSQISSIPHPISWENKPVSFKTGANSITITAGKETDLYSFVDGSYYINNAPKMLFTPDSTFIFSAKITPDFKSTYDGGALLVYSDSENWAKLLFERNEDGTMSLGASLVENKIGDDSYHLSLNTNTVYTKVLKSGKVFCFYYSTNGKDWKLVRTFPYRQFQNLRIGFYAQSPKGENCTVKFEDISYQAKAFKNFFTGE